MTTDRIGQPIVLSKDPANIDRPKRIRKSNLFNDRIYKSELLYAKYDDAGTLLSFIVQEDDFYVMYERPTVDWPTVSDDMEHYFFVIPTSDLIVYWERKR